MRATFNGFTFDPHRRQLTRGGGEVALTPKAFALLEALINAAPDAVSKEKLYDLLWGETFVESGNLHNLVSEVRAAIGDEDHAIIRTVHRIGYAFAAPLVREQSSSPRLHIGNDVIDLAPGDTIIGRERLGTPDVSRQHARITVAGSEISIEDLGSKNGTFVDGKSIKRRTVIRDGSEIIFGRTRATLRVVDAGAPTVTATGSRG
jgi:DNA-binding winged helix-turn-helix (wHTH) protein